MVSKLASVRARLSSVLGACDCREWLDSMVASPSAGPACAGAAEGDGGGESGPEPAGSDGNRGLPTSRMAPHGYTSTRVQHPPPTLTLKAPAAAAAAAAVANAAIERSNSFLREQHRRALLGRPPFHSPSTLPWPGLHSPRAAAGSAGGAYIHDGCTHDRRARTPGAIATQGCDAAHPTARTLILRRQGFRCAITAMALGVLRRFCCCRCC